MSTHAASGSSNSVSISICALLCCKAASSIRLKRGFFGSDITKLDLFDGIDVRGVGSAATQLKIGVAVNDTTRK